MDSEEKRLKDFYEQWFDYPERPAFEDENEEFKKYLRGTAAFARYNVACAWRDLKEEIKKSVVKILPKN